MSERQCQTCPRLLLPDDRGPDCWPCWARKRDDARRKGDVLREAFAVVTRPLTTRSDPHANCVPGEWCEACELRVDERLEDEAGMGVVW